MDILIVGAGIAGIGTALALSGPERQLTVIDRDPPPPEGDSDYIFDEWSRKGATQARHSHVFLARLFNLLRDKYPALLDELFEAGARELRFADGLPNSLKRQYRPLPGDRDMSILSCRRTTLEAVMRRYAERLPGVRFLSDSKVRGISIDRNQDGLAVAKALTIENSKGDCCQMTADLIVDASGRNTLFSDWLAAERIEPHTEESPAGILYYTKHYRLRPGHEEPDRSTSTHPGAGDLGFIKYGLFPADKGNFSVTLAVPEIETELRQRVVFPDVFDRICASLPGLARWTDAGRSEPTSKVFAMGNLKSSWKHWVEKDRPHILNFFAVGDASIRTNPLYGRGCSTSILHAHILADVLRATKDPVARAKFFAERTTAELRPFYDLMVNQDKAAIRRAKTERDPNNKPRLRARLMRSFAEDGIAPAVRGDIRVLRELMRSFHMIDRPTRWLQKPDVIGRVLAVWATPKPAKKHLYVGKLGPDRTEMLSLTELDNL